MGIGDELMAAGRAYNLSQQNAAAKVHICDARGVPRWHDVWERCPWVARPTERAVRFRIIDGPNARPYIAAKSHERWTWKAYGPMPSPVLLREEEWAWARGLYDAVILCPYIKRTASPNKRWPWHAWQRLAAELRRDGFRVVQLRESDSMLMLDRATPLTAPSLWHAGAALGMARAAVVHEGGMHHLSACVGGKAVVIAGGYIGHAQTGYSAAEQIWIGTENEGCGKRLPCDHCRGIMDGILPEYVLEQVRRLTIAAAV